MRQVETEETEGPLTTEGLEAESGKTSALVSAMPRRERRRYERRVMKALGNRRTGVYGPGKVPWPLFRRPT